MVSGGIAEVGNGTVEIEGASAENVSFLSSGSGGLDLDDATAYTGKVSGFGGVGHSNTHEYIDLTSVRFSAGEMVSSGVLTVTSSGATVATIDIVGSHVTSDFKLRAGSGGSGIITTDPAGSLQPVTNVRSANAALFGSYLAGSFVTAAGGNGGTVNTEMPDATIPAPMLTHPHG